MMMTSLLVAMDILCEAEEEDEEEITAEVVVQEDEEQEDQEEWGEEELQLGEGGVAQEVVNGDVALAEEAVLLASSTQCG